MLKEFKEFAMRGNVLDLAVGVIIGAAFGKVVSSLVDDVIMPPIGQLLGRVNFSDLFLNLSNKSYDSLAAAKAAGARCVVIPQGGGPPHDFTLVDAVVPSLAAHELATILGLA